MSYQIIKYGNKVELRHNLDIGTSILVKSKGEEPWVDITALMPKDYFGGYYIGDMYNFWPNYNPDKPDEDWYVPDEYCSSGRGWTSYYSDNIVARGRLQIETTAGITTDLWNYYDLNKALADATSNCTYNTQEFNTVRQSLQDNGYWINNDTFMKLVDDIGSVSVNGGLSRLAGFVAQETHWRKIFYTTRTEYKVFFNSQLGYKVEVVSSSWEVGGSNT